MPSEFSLITYFLLTFGGFLPSAINSSVLSSTLLPCLNCLRSLIPGLILLVWPVLIVSKSSVVQTKRALYPTLFPLVESGVLSKSDKLTDYNKPHSVLFPYR